MLKLDTGSLRSQLPYDFVERVGLPKRIKETERKNMSYPFKNWKVYGKINIMLRLGEGEAVAKVPHTYYVVDRKVGILGSDFFHKYACQVNLDIQDPRIHLFLKP